MRKEKKETEQNKTKIPKSSLIFAVDIPLSDATVSARHWISCRLESTLISADCSLHRVLTQRRKVISSLRTWLGLLLLPLRRPPVAPHWGKDGGGVKVKERDHNSPWMEVWDRRIGDILLWGLVNCLKSAFPLPDSYCCFVTLTTAATTYCTHTHLHNYHSIDKKAIPGSK